MAGPLKTSPLPVCVKPRQIWYFCIKASNDVRINRREPQKLRSAGAPPHCGSRLDTIHERELRDRQTDRQTDGETPADSKDRAYVERRVVKKNSSKSVDNVLSYAVLRQTGGRLNSHAVSDTDRTWIINTHVDRISLQSSRPCTDTLQCASHTWRCWRSCSAQYNRVRRNLPRTLQTNQHTE